MKTKGTLTMTAIALVFLFAAPLAADNWKGDRGRSGFGREERGGHHQRGRDDRRGYDDRRGHDDRDWHRDYRDHRDYRERPYDRGRHYGHYRHQGHRYDYRGHWRSWDAWDRYARSHPFLYRHGHYYRDGVHLMFRFCDPAGAGCFFFSIGR